MHVNAEVIFYGGTDPHAKVTIDGKPVTLNPDGSFRYHFIFPDGVYEIPIVAISPDGKESRSAVLRFERGTQTSGNVGATSTGADTSSWFDFLKRKALPSRQRVRAPAAQDYLVQQFLLCLQGERNASAHTQRSYHRALDAS